MTRRVLASALVAATSILLSGCMTPSQQSDWQWKQYNPGYRDPYPANPDPFKPGIF